jgi:hypothetical protein
MTPKNLVVCRDWISIIWNNWNRKILKVFKYFIPVCVIGFIMLTSVVAGDGTNSTYLINEAIMGVQADLPKALAAYHEIEKLAGGIQKASTKNRLEEDTSFLYAFLFIRYGQQYRIDPTLLAAVTHEESEFNHKAVSSSRAKGLMQIHPVWRLSDKDSFDPEKNIKMGSKILFILRNSDPKSFLQKYVGVKENIEEGVRYEKAVKSKQAVIAKLSKGRK